VGHPVLVVGNSVVDVIGLAPEGLPAFGELVPGRGPARMCVGGNGAIAAAAAAALGADVELASAVGDDNWGRWLTDRLIALGVGVRQLQARTDGPTSTTISLVRPDGERALVTHNGVAGAHDPGDVSVEGMPEGSWLLVGALLLVPAYSGEALRGLATRARDAGLRVALDLSWDPTGAWDLGSVPVDLADVMLGNADELRNATRAPDVGAAMEAVLAAGARSVVAKLGPEGATVAARGGGPASRMAAPRVRALNATGTGDVFNGALLVALSGGAPLEEAVRFACGAGALRVSGGCDTFPRTSEVERALSRASGP
jgi:ribokinase